LKLLRWVEGDDEGNLQSLRYFHTTHLNTAASFSSHAVLSGLTAVIMLFLSVFKMILAEGEVKASRALKEAASGLSSVAFQLRYLQSLSAVQSSASIVVFTLPAELLRNHFPAALGPHEAHKLKVSAEKKVH